MWTYLFLKNHVTSEEAVSHNVCFLLFVIMYYQQLSIALYQVSLLCSQLFWVITSSVSEIGPNKKL